MNDMKKLIFVFILVLTASLVAQSQNGGSKTKIACFKSSMHCASCEKTVFDLLQFEKGVKEVKTDLPSNTIKVVYDERKNSPDAIAKVIENKGYKADVISEEEYKKMVK
jgi:copper chaperone CopZ